MTGRVGISTSISATACTRYSFRTSRRNPFSRRVTSTDDPNINVGFVYLIDASNFKGFAIPSPRPDDETAKQTPHLRDIYEVNFACNIPGSKIVGIVWPLGGRGDGLKECRGYWLPRPKRLWLAVNPNYEKQSLITDDFTTGMEAAKIVARRFNDRQTSSIVESPRPQRSCNIL